MKLNETRSFDEVFYVPNVPNQNQANDQTNNTKSFENNGAEPEEEDKKLTEIDKPEESSIPPKEENENGKDETEEAPSKTPTTAERRKMFENEENLDSIDNKNFERGGSQRASIAERRQMYENKSMSVIENATAEKVASPVMLRRQNSSKTSRNKEDVVSKDDNKKNFESIKQLAQNSQVTKKNEIVAAPPKRTSTVFGELC